MGNITTFLENYACLEKQEIKNSQNIYKILGMENMEIKHSNFLAYLFDSAVNENIGNVILKEFLKASDVEKILSQANLTVNDLFSSNVKIEVSRENSNIDILIKFVDVATVLIENKIWADEHGKQLFRYETTIKQEIANKTQGFNNILKTPICIYLTPDGRKAHEDGSENWIPYGYNKVYEILKVFYKSEQFLTLSKKQKFLIEDYIKLLEENILGNKDEIKQILDEFYSNKEKRRVMEDIIKYVPDYKKRAEIIKQICLANGEEIMPGSATAYINIMPHAYAEQFQLKGLGKYFVYFQFANNSSFAPQLQVYFDLSSEDKDKSKNYVARFFDEFHGGQKTFNKTLDIDRSLGLTIPILTYDEEYSLTEEEKQQKIKQFFEKFNYNSNFMKLLLFIQEFKVE